MKCMMVGCKKEATFLAEFQGKINGGVKPEVRTCEGHNPALGKKVGEFYGYAGMKLYKVVAR